MTRSASAERWIASTLHRRDAVFQPCGTAALELALVVCGVHPGDEVIIPEECCTAVLGAVVRAGARPVLARTDANCLLAPEAVNEVVTSRTKAVIAIHQWGALVDCSAIRADLPPDITLVEDAAPYWNTVQPPPTGSDLVVVSFGQDKPLSLGWGGALCSDLPAARIACALDGPPVFERDQPFVPTAVPPPNLSVLQRADRAAQTRLRGRRALAEQLSAKLSELDGHLLGEDLLDHCWQAFPLVMPTSGTARIAATTAAAVGLTARTLNSRSLPDTPLAIRNGIRAPRESAFQDLADRLVVLMPPRRPSTQTSQILQWLHRACLPSRARTSEQRVK